MNRPWVALGLAAALAGSARANARLVPDELAGPPLELASEPPVALPAVPAFALPVVEPGVHTPRELRVRGRRLLDTEVRVRGYVTAIYDCAAVLALRDPTASPAALRHAIDEDPRRCEQPKFYLGDLRGASRDGSITVVDVPRAPARPERESLSRAELAHWPAVPTLAVGDYVTVLGVWSTTSPHGERSLRGLLVYRGVAPAPAEAAAASGLVIEEVLPPITVETRPPLRELIDNITYNKSIDPLNACTRALREARYDDAIARCEESLRVWPYNHRAWFGIASAHIARSRWQDATAAIGKAVELRPDVAMYQLWDGVVRYEAEVARARGTGAVQQHRRPEDVELDPSTLTLGAAREALRRAVALAPGLWRAHYYLGRIDEDLDDGRGAALALSQAIVTHPTYQPAYARLAELYRRWGYGEPAVAVAMLGASRVAPGERQAMWLEAGMALAERGTVERAANAQAIDALGRAIGPGTTLDVQARFQRAQVYLRMGDARAARRDLLEVLRAAGPGIDELRPVAAQLLQQSEQQGETHEAQHYCHGSTRC
ncbi:MAG TPA: hypothetical protein VGC42_04350 [Kofleriaceae bacterium]